MATCHLSCGGRDIAGLWLCPLPATRGVPNEQKDVGLGGLQVLLPWEAQGCSLGEHSAVGTQKRSCGSASTADTSTNGDVQPMRWTQILFPGGSSGPRLFPHHCRGRF